MEVLRIDVSKKNDGLDEIYDILEKNGEFIVYPNNFILVTENETIYDTLNKINNIQVFKIEDIDLELDKEYIKTWIRQVFISYEIKEAKREVEERMTAIYEILSETEKRMKKQGEVKKNVEKDTKAN